MMPLRLKLTHRLSLILVISPYQQSGEHHLLNTMPEVFALHDMGYGHTDKVKHCIKLGDEAPFKHLPRPIHPQDIDAVRKHLQDLLAAEIICESESPFASPIMVVRKKDNSVRLCINFRKLYSQTIKDAYAPPKLEEVFSILTDSKWFSILYSKLGYYQKHKPLCALKDSESLIECHKGSRMLPVPFSGSWGAVWAT